jgi:hypothetical protein
MVNIATGSHSSSASLSGRKEAPPYMLPLVCLVAMPIAFQSKRRRWWLTILMTGLIGITSCAGAGGGSGGTPASPNGSTPAGSYSIVVTTTASGVSHNTTLTLTVD